MPTSVRSHTKINLGLAIGPLRPDGFHQLTTVYQTLALHEWVTVEARSAAATRITLSSTHPRVPTDAGNTAWRMVERCLELLGLQAEVHIHIDKQLPVQGGLGGGSANAIAALMGLEHELDRRLSPPDRLLAGGGDRFRYPAVSAGRSGGRGGTRGGGLPSARYSVATLRPRPAGNRGFYPPGLPRLGQPAGRAALTLAAPSATITVLSRSIAAAFGEPHSSGVFSGCERRPGRGSASRACPNRDRKRL